MFSISDNNIITVSRGDSFAIPIFVNHGTRQSPERYRIRTGDKVYFSLMEPHMDFENGLIRRILTKDDEMTDSHDLILRLAPEETENLLEGTYYYSIKLRRRKNGKVYTLLTKTKLYII